jgi:hypothetical protein
VFNYANSKYTHTYIYIEPGQIRPLSYRLQYFFISSFFRLTIVLFVLLRFMDSDYPFDIFKLFFEHNLHDAAFISRHMIGYLLHIDSVYKSTQLLPYPFIITFVHPE